MLLGFIFLILIISYQLKVLLKIQSKIFYKCPAFQRIPGLWMYVNGKVTDNQNIRLRLLSPSELIYLASFTMPITIRIPM